MKERCGTGLPGWSAGPVIDAAECTAKTPAADNAGFAPVEPNMEVSVIRW